MKLKSSIPLFLAALLSITSLAQAQSMDLFSSEKAAVEPGVMAAVRARDKVGTITTIAAVKLNMQALNAGTRTFNMNMGSGRSFTMRQTRAGNTGAGYTYWHGQTANAKSGKTAELNPNTVNFVMNGDRVFGQIRMDGKVFEVYTTEGGKHLMYGRDFTVIGTEDDTPVERAILPAPSGKGQGKSRPSTPAVPLASDLNLLVAGGTEIRVMQIISGAAVNALGGVSPAVDRLNFFISQANEAYNITGLPPQVVSAGLFFTEGQTELSSAVANIQSLVDTNDSFQDSIATNTRDSQAADLVGMIVATPFDPGICGIVNSIGSSSSTQGFFVVKQSCTDFTWVHEVGHLIGARHDNDPTGVPFSFARGIVQPGCNFRTIMAVSSNPQPRFGGFSDPGFSLGGCPFGTSTRDNGQAHEINASVIANFR